MFTLCVDLNLFGMEVQQPVGAYIRSLKEEMRATNAWLMDTENWVLEYKWKEPERALQGGLLDGLKFFWTKPHPKGRRRFEDPAWAELMKQALADTNTSWETYTAWCEGGGGDEWFTEVTAPATRMAGLPCTRTSPRPQHLLQQPMLI